MKTSLKQNSATRINHLSKYLLESNHTHTHLCNLFYKPEEIPRFLRYSGFGSASNNQILPSSWLTLTYSISKSAASGLAEFLFCVCACMWMGREYFCNILVSPCIVNTFISLKEDFI